MEPAECRRRFSTARVAHLATVDATGRPHAVPIVFALGERGRRTVIYTAIDHKPKSTTHLKRLANIAADPRVAVLVDHYADDWTELWWVRADGRAGVIDAPQEREASIEALAARYRQYRDRRPQGPVIAVTVDAWRGWSAR